MATRKLAVNGFSCQSCVRRVTDLLLSLESIAEVSVELSPDRTQPSIVTLSLTDKFKLASDDELLSFARLCLPSKFTVVSVLSPQLNTNSCGSVCVDVQDDNYENALRNNGQNPNQSSASSSDDPTDFDNLIPDDIEAAKETIRSSTNGYSNVPESERLPRNATFAISGMTCVSCVVAVQGALLGCPGVEKASVSLLTSRAVIRADPEICNRQLIVNVLADKGYGAEYLPVNEAGTENEIYFRFPSLSTAERAVEILRNAPHVADVKLVKPRNDKRTSTVTCGTALVRRAFQRRRNSQASSLIKVSCTNKLEVAKTLDEEEGISYEVVARNDPERTGALEPIEVLRAEARHLLGLFIGALVLTLPLVLITMLCAKVPALGADKFKSFLGNSGFRVVDTIGFVLATPVQFVIGFRFYKGSWYSLKRRTANMDVLIASGTTIAYFFSVIVLVLNTVQIRKGDEVSEEGIAFEVSAMLITIVLFGKWMQTVAKMKTAVGVEALSKLAPRGVTLVAPPPSPPKELYDGPVHVELVSVGDYFRVNPGASFPLDGKIADGQTTVDESMLTGESWPVRKEVGDSVYAGTVNGSQSVVVLCTATESGSMLEKIIGLVKRAQESRAPIEAFADRVSAVFVPVVLLIALGVMLVWFILAQTKAIPDEWTSGEGNVLFSILFGLSVLVIACPCALGLATPTVIMVATSIGARRLGILFKDGGEALQAAHNVKAVLFDKTGTLTLGSPTVTSVATIDVENARLPVVADDLETSKIPQDTLQIFAAAESTSDHPLAKAIAEYVDKNATNVGENEVTFLKSETVTGKGVRCSLVSGETVWIGQANWVITESCGNDRFPREGKDLLSEWESCGRTVVLARVSEGPIVVFGIEDPIRSESVSVISHLQRNGVSCGMVTGDGEGTAKAVARALGISQRNVFARQMPSDKIDVVQTFLSSREDTKVEGRKSKNQKGIAFVGDGINDAGALSAASIGIAMGSGSQIAAESAGIVLVSPNLWDVVVALDLARKSFTRIRMNYLWALGYNTLGIPLAAGALYPWLQTRIPPYAAAAAMGLSSISVVLSSLSLGLYTKPIPETN